jgi:hypothetical protein
VIFCRRPTYAVQTGDRDRENMCHRPLLTKQFGSRDEAIFLARRKRPETVKPYQIGSVTLSCQGTGGVSRRSPSAVSADFLDVAMLEVVTAFFGIISAGIFIAHAVDGYRSRP